MIITYGFIFQIGRNVHKVELYMDGSWSKDSGLTGNAYYTLEDSRMDILLKDLKKQGVSKVALESVKMAMQSRDRLLIVNNEGKVHEAK